jgi:Fe-S cluster assembly protein SufB
MMPDTIKTLRPPGNPDAERKFPVLAPSMNRRWLLQNPENLEKQGVPFWHDDGLRNHPTCSASAWHRDPNRHNKPLRQQRFRRVAHSFISRRQSRLLYKLTSVNMASIGQFERTMIIADEGSQVHYVEGCTAPVYTTDSFHSGVIEIVVKKGARVRYTTIQNWSTNVYNLVTQRAMVHENATMEWVDANMGSKLTMKYPSVYLVGNGAHGEILSMAFAGKGQHQDAGGKALHFAPHTTSKITSKSISKDGGRTSYRGLLKVHKDAEDSRSNVVCDALLLDELSRSDTYPYIEIDAEDVTIGYEASVSSREEQLFYLMAG